MIALLRVMGAILVALVFGLGWLLTRTTFLLLVVIILLAALYSTRAHDIYTGIRNRSGNECCGLAHCHPIDGAHVRIMEFGSKRGYWVDTDAAESSWIEEDQALPSPNGQYHICGSGRNVTCFFRPTVGM